MNKPKKANHQKLTAEILKQRAAWSKHLGYEPPKWVEFCERLMTYGFSISLYEARETVSKYITISDGEKSFKVRFSNHKPIKEKEKNGDCDFFVGKTNLAVTNTEMAFNATLEFFGMINA